MNLERDSGRGFEWIREFSGVVLVHSFRFSPLFFAFLCFSSLFFESARICSDPRESPHFSIITLVNGANESSNRIRFERAIAASILMNDCNHNKPAEPTCSHVSLFKNSKPRFLAILRAAGFALRSPLSALRSRDSLAASLFYQAIHNNEPEPEPEPNSKSKSKANSGRRFERHSGDAVNTSD